MKQVLFVKCQRLNSSMLCVVAAMVLPLSCRPAVERSPSSSAITRSTADSIEQPVSEKLTADIQSKLAFTEQLFAESFRYSNGSAAGINSIVETLGGGLALLDYDRDGHTDLLATRGGHFTADRNPIGEPSRLFRGDGTWHFTPVVAGLKMARHFTHGCSAADFDNDGFSDLLITGFGGLQLFHNQGDGTFTEVTDAAQLHDSMWSTGAAWGDINRDGCLDLYVAHYVDWSPAKHRACDDPNGGRNEICGPKHYEAINDRLFVSRGDGKFEDATKSAGLIAGGKGLGVVIGDVDLDDDLDIYVANDTTDNFLYLNRGDGTFDEVGQSHGAALDDAGRPTGSMGVDLADFDADGLPDLWTANYEHEIFGLYRNLGGGRFLHASRPMGFAAIGDRYVGWGTGFADFDRDGDLDVIATTGHVKRFPTAAPVKQLPLVWLNESRPDGQRRFLRQSFPANSYLGTSHDGRGLALGDLDDDGDIDVAISHNDRPLALLSNETPPEGNWLRVRLIGRNSPRDAIGARLGLHLSSRPQHVGSRTDWRQINGGGSYLSQNDLRPFWGIPDDATSGNLEIHWPSGTTQWLRDVKLGTSMTVIEQ